MLKCIATIIRDRSYSITSEFSLTVDMPTKFAGSYTEGSRTKWEFRLDKGGIGFSLTSFRVGVSARQRLSVRSFSAGTTITAICNKTSKQFSKVLTNVTE